MNLTDTILAISSPPAGGGGKGATGIRSILRLSGPDAWPLAAALLPLPSPLTPGHHSDLPLPLLHPTLPVASVLLFKSPHSFTGQDIAELHLPASPALLGAVSNEFFAFAQGRARPAEPGEFSARAFFNQKIDLTQAEGIAATINAANALQLRAAASLREGHLFKQMESFAQSLATMLALVEAGIDFVDEEDISFIQADAMQSDLFQLRAGLMHLVAHAVRIDRMDGLPTVVFIGLPNVGKSSLINALARQERSIVSPAAGTTRDMLAVVMHTSAGDVRLVDVPGEEVPADEMRSKMMAARDNALLEADLIIEVMADERTVVSGLGMSARLGAETYSVQNKVDLLPAEELRTEIMDNGERMGLCAEWQMVSAKTGLNVALLREAIGELVYRRQFISANLPALNQRHRLILQECKEAIQAALDLITGDAFLHHPELLAAELRRGLDLLGQITGTISPDEILGRIFSSFCIGK